MMTKQFIITSVGLLFLCFTVRAQQSNIQGSVHELQNRPADGAIVSLFVAADTTLIKTTFTDESGHFEFSRHDQGPWFLTVQHLGYQIYCSEVISQPEYTFDSINLQTSAGPELQQVQVIGSIPFIVRKPEGYVVQPDALLSSAGNTALEILEKSPGIQVDSDGNIRLRGQSGVTVYIDDRPTYLSATELGSYLKSLPASSIQSITIMTNPPARYDAAGSAGIILIKLKKSKTIGTNGGLNLSYGQGRYMRSNNSFNINKRVDRYNWYGQLSHGTNNNFHDLTINRSYLTSEGQLQNAFDQNTLIRTTNHGVNGKVGMDFYPNDQSVFGVALSGFYNYNDENTRNISNLSDSLRQPVNQVTSITPAVRDFYNTTVSLNYQWSPDTLGSTLSIGTDYARFYSEMDQTLTSSSEGSNSDQDTTTVLDSRLPSTITIWTAKADFSKVYTSGWRWENGAKTSFVTTVNDAYFYDVYNNVSTTNTLFTNSYTYKENINAVYTSLNKEKGRWSYQIGLRYEGTRINGKQSSLQSSRDSLFQLEYDGLFPTAYATYQVDTAGRHVLGLNYGRRINRPNYQDLNPFTYPLDPYTLYSGNPFLRPSFSHELEMSYTLDNNWTATLYFGRREDEINETIEQVNPIFYSRPGNIGSSEYYGLSINGSKKMTKWWMIQFYAEWMQNAFNSDLYGQRLENSGSYLYVGPNMQFTLNNKWSAEIAGNYQTSVYSGQFVLVPVGSMRIAVGKKIWKNQGSIRCSLNDVFYTNRPGGTIKGIGDSTAGWNSVLDTRVFQIAINYRFTKGETRANRSIGSSDTESQRVR
jgi:iron complex outermembrane recepter protein